MRIAVDARPAYQEKTLRGVGKTLVSLYRALARVRPGWRFDLFYQCPNGRDPLAGVGTARPRAVDGPGDRFGAWQEVWLPAAAWRARADLLHCHGAIAPRFPATRLVVTIHDLTPLEFRPADPDVRAWAANVARAARKAARVLTGSGFVRDQVVRVLDVPADKVTVVRWGPNEAVAKVADPAEVRAVAARYGVADGQPYLLHFGMALARKNTRRVLEAWAGLPAAARGGAALVVVGLEGAALDRFRTAARDLGAEASCRLHGYVPEDDIPALLTGTAGLCYVALSEGFGLPILDAFACDAPVLASRTTSIPEVAGDAARYVDPASTDDVRRGMGDLLTDPALRADLVARGRDRLKGFTWDGCAEEVAGVFEQVGS